VPKAFEFPIFQEKELNMGNSFNSAKPVGAAIIRHEDAKARLRCRTDPTFLNAA